ncbi:EAL domain-containing protein [Butyrivibrio sp. WCE2006]|uniref:EAL domain-containing protein n=1 Tax=Butyrivibrio sp. WCE2006 TaxID=1410611 RepID=UPI000679E01C|nr:EAL domain-containing protein [Butyrivibrio sp. WCE2006]
MHRNEEIDQLTGLPNLYSFRKEAQKLMDSRKNREREFVIIYFDIQNFKSYNARYGFEAGDRFLQNIAKHISKIFPELMVARFSDDHFVVLAYYDSIESRIDDLGRRVKSYNPDAGVDLRAGIYEIDPDDMDISIACDRARIACNSIKKNYDSIFRYYDKELGIQLELAHYIIHHIGDAVLHGYIQVYYQPVVRVITGRVCGFEALARWVDPVHGFLMPGVFIPILEDAHLIYKLDTYIIRQVCQDLKELMDMGLKPHPVSVNLSRTDFHQKDMYRVVNDAVGMFNIPKNLIHVEVTESALDDNQDVLKGTIDKFRRGGYQVWMDDFGSGYSSLNLLKDYEFDVLKFDMKFLQNFGSNPKETAIWENVINMAEEIGIQTLAEGVETIEAWDFLKRVGCEKAQGYFFGRPMTKEECLDYLDECKEITRQSVAEKDEEALDHNKKIIELKKEDDDPAEEERIGSIDDELFMAESPVYLTLAARGFVSLLEYNSYSQFQKHSFFIVANLSQNKLLRLHLSSKRKILDKAYYSDESYQNMIDEIVQNTVIQDEQENVADFFGKDRLILAYHSGITSDEIEFHRIVDKKMAPRWTHTIYQVMEDKGDLIGYFLSFDIDEYKRSKDLVRQMAERDSLTGLYNRHTAVPLIRNRLYRHQHGQSALIMADIDDFRRINDSYGHFAGDEVLRRISARLDDIFGRDGIVCHLDQDEFLIFVENIDEDNLKSRIDTLCENIFEVNYHNDKISFTISAGFVIHPDQGRGYHDLFRKADMALGDAKKKGKGMGLQFNEQ